MKRHLKSNQPQTANSQRKPVAPPAYRPQPVPKVLQRKALNTPAAAAEKPARVSAPPVYRPLPTPKILQRKTATPNHPNSVPRPGVIQRAKGVGYTQIGLTYSAQEIAAAGGATPAHGSGGPGDGQNANTTKKNAELVERLQEHRARAKEEHKAAVVAKAKEKRAGKKPTKKQAREHAAALAERHDLGTGIEKFDEYLLSWFSEEELAENNFRELYPM